jgi:RHS repeat-associated protein
MPTPFRMPSCRRKGATPSRIPIRKTGITTTTGTAWTAPTQNAVGNLTQTPQPLALGSGYDLKYDAWNRLVEVKVTGGSVVATHRYDGANRRVTKLTGANTQHYYYSDQWQILEERLNAGASADRRFVWGQRYPDDLVLRDQGGARLYALHDYFHPTAVIDTTGAVQERYGYDGFGTPRYMTAAFGSRASSVHGWETLYGAYRYDLESGLYQVRNRYLHCKLGRWLSRDPLGEPGFEVLPGGKNNDLSDGPNLYAYIHNNPINTADPDGLLAPLPILLVSLAVGNCLITAYLFIQFFKCWERSQELNMKARERLPAEEATKWCNANYGQECLPLLGAALAGLGQCGLWGAGRLLLLRIGINPILGGKLGGG